ncbi:protein SapB [Lachnospiraceae bacterium]|nr:protein SapB [Lachnospiraceae bacterium]
MVLERIEILRELTLPSILLRTFLAMVLSGILGYEREKRHRPAGFRTYLVVCLGSTLAMMVGIYLTTIFDSIDAGRIPAQVISGIGFLGAGTILVTRQNQVKGLTTAAGLWAVACMGLALGAGFYTGALVVFAAIGIALKMLRVVNRHLNPASKLVILHVEFEKIADMSKFISFAKSKNCTVEHLEMTRGRSTAESTSVSATITLCFHEEVTYSQIVETYGALEGVTFIDYVNW